jgi:hypothetical protein
LQVWLAGDASECDPVHTGDTFFIEFLRALAGMIMRNAVILVDQIESDVQQEDEKKFGQEPARIRVTPVWTWSIGPSAR